MSHPPEAIAIATLFKLPVLEDLYIGSCRLNHFYISLARGPAILKSLLRVYIMYLMLC